MLLQTTTLGNKSIHHMIRTCFSTYCSYTTDMHLCSTQTCMCVLAPKLYKDCKDVLNTTDDSLLPAGCFGLNATSLANRRRNSNNDVWRMADTLQQMAADGQSYSEMEKLYGLSYTPWVSSMT